MYVWTTAGQSGSGDNHPIGQITSLIAFAQVMLHDCRISVPIPSQIRAGHTRTPARLVDADGMRSRKTPTLGVAMTTFIVVHQTNSRILTSRGVVANVQANASNLSTLWLGATALVVSGILLVVAAWVMVRDRLIEYRTARRRRIDCHARLRSIREDEARQRPSQSGVTMRTRVWLSVSTHGRQASLPAATRPCGIGRYLPRIDQWICP